MEFRELAELCGKLESMNRRSEMVALVADFLKRSTPEEIKPAVLMMLGRTFPKWSPQTFDVSWATLHSLILNITGVKPEKFAEAFDKTGDLGSATAIVFWLGRKSRQLSLLEKPLTLLEVQRVFDQIARAKGPGRRERKERLRVRASSLSEHIFNFPANTT